MHERLRRIEADLSRIRAERGSTLDRLTIALFELVALLNEMDERLTKLEEKS